MKRYFIIDFDSTFVKVEALDELARIALAKNKHKEKIIREVQEITRQGMEGKISFSESLSRRLSLFSISKEHVSELITFLEANISTSVIRNKEFFEKYSHVMYVISGGFKDYIIPIVKEFGIEPEHVLANDFIFDKKGNVTGYDKKNLLAQSQGKVKQLKKLGLKGTVCVIGDGMTDYEMRESQMAQEFYAFVENVKRQEVVHKADLEVKNLDELLYSLRLPRKFSYPKSKIKVLLLENIHNIAIQAFEDEGYRVETVKGALSEKDLIERVQDVSILGIRSKTEVGRRVFESAPHLLALGAFCIGTNQIDLAAAQQNGVAVFNAPFSNTRSVVELVIGEIIMLARNIFDASSSLHKGVWNKSAKGSIEVRGKTLGIVGYGNIGSQLSVVAESLGMHVLFYDLADKLALGNAKRCKNLEELLSNSDFVTLHVDGRRENQMFFGEKEFSMMKKGSVFLNLSRGFVVDVNALTAYIKNGMLKGAAVDVFLEEPKNNDEKFVSSLQHLPNVILTPHIGGSTEEAQEDIGNFVSGKIIDFINSGSTTLSVDLPNISLPEFANAHRIIHIHKNIPGVLAAMNRIFAENSINITGQYLKTNEEVGYVITDVDKRYDEKIVNELKKIEATIKVRMLY